MTDDSSAYTWSPPVYDLSAPPTSKHESVIEDDGNHENFARNARWTPDGSAFMAHCENRTLQLFSSTSSPTLVVRQPAPILDFTWYPTASPSDPASYCFLASVRECPVKLLDASDGRLRASYKIIDHRERFVSPQCMTFSLDATRIYCGYEDAIEVFDVSRPGEGTRIATTPSKKSKDGLKGNSQTHMPQITSADSSAGIVSSIAFSPSYNTDSSEGAFFAAGTLNSTYGNIALYNDAQMDVPLMFVGGGERAAVTQLRFNPTNPNILYAAYRRRDTILAWDLRSDVNTPLARYVIPNAPTTNQKMWFDMDISGTRLAVGDQKGNVHIFDLAPPTSEDDQPSEWDKEGAGTLTYNPALSFPAHSDSVGGVSFHPYQPLLLSVSGSRYYGDAESAELEDDSDDEEGEDDLLCATDNRTQLSSKLGLRTRPVAKDSSIKCWSFNGD